MTYYISLYVEKTTYLSYEPARWSCDYCQRMSDFDSCQFILIRMAYKVLISPRCDSWHQLTWSVCTGGRTLRHNQIFSDGWFTKFSYPWCSANARFARARAPLQIQKYIANKKIIKNYAQMKYKWPITAIKLLKNKLFSATSNPSTLVYFMSSMIQFHSWLKVLTAARLNQTWFKNYFPVSLSTIYNIKREDAVLEILYSSTIKR